MLARSASFKAQHNTNNANSELYITDACERRTSEKMKIDKSGFSTHGGTRSNVDG